MAESSRRPVSAVCRPSFLLRVSIVASIAAALALGCRTADRGASGDAAIRGAFEGQRSGVWVQSQGRVERLLADDQQGSPHQRFVVRLANGHTVLIAHNLDLAERAELRPGDQVAFRGEYEWNPRGGVVHWTHDDPQGRIRGGWLEVRGRRLH